MQGAKRVTMAEDGAVASKLPRLGNEALALMESKTIYMADLIYSGSKSTPFLMNLTHPFLATTSICVKFDSLVFSRSVNVHVGEVH